MKKQHQAEQGLSGCPHNAGAHAESGGECPKCKRPSVILYRVVDGDHDDKLLYTWLECQLCGWRNNAKAYH